MNILKFGEQEIGRLLAKMLSDGFNLNGHHVLMLKRKTPGGYDWIDYCVFVETADPNVIVVQSLTVTNKESEERVMRGQRQTLTTDNARTIWHSLIVENLYTNQQEHSHV